jgi:hypothetical protein
MDRKMDRGKYEKEAEAGLNSLLDRPSRRDLVANLEGVMMANSTNGSRQIC